MAVKRCRPPSKIGPLLEKVEYIVFEYVENETIVSGKPFLIAMRFSAHSGPRVRGFAVSGWESFVLEDHDYVTNYIVDFIFDLHQLDFKDEASAIAIFNQTSELCVGPVRALTAGTRPLNQMFRQGDRLLEEGRGVTVCPELDFAQLLVGIQTCQ